MRLEAVTLEEQGFQVTGLAAYFREAEGGACAGEPMDGSDQDVVWPQIGLVPPCITDLTERSELAAASVDEAGSEGGEDLQIHGVMIHSIWRRRDQPTFILRAPHSGTPALRKAVTSRCRSASRRNG